MLKKLRNRFILINMCLVSIVLIVTFASLIVSSANRLENDSFRDLEKDYMRQISPDKDEKMFQEQNTASNPEKMREPPKEGTFDKQSHFSTFYVMVDDAGNIININDMNNVVDVDVAKQAVSTVREQNQDRGVISELNLRYMTNSEECTTMIGFVDISFEKDFIQQQVLNYCLIGIGSLVAFFFISLVLSRMAIKPIEKAWKQQQQFVADASHELKTPITVMLANTSILLSNQSRMEKQEKKWISYIDLEAKRMKKLVEDLLFLARIDSKEKTKLYSKISLSDIIMESVLPFEAVIFESGKELKTEIDSDIYINGDVGQIKQLVSILLDNACKYAIEHSTISIELNKNSNKAILSVHNLSEPIPENEIKHIFDRFYRIDKARGREKNSYGLGLSIAKEIVNAHNGKIAVLSDSDHGTNFNVTLPIVL